MSPDVAALEARNQAERIMTALHREAHDAGEARIRSQLVRHSSQARLARWAERNAS